MTILVLASIADETAGAFVEALQRDCETALVTCRDLAERPLDLRLPDFDSSAITVGRRALPVREISGVVHALPAVFPSEVAFYPPEEREYQASEFHAMLSFFLSALPCPVVNRPSAAALSGPYPHPFGWHGLARRVGISTVPIALDTDHFRNPFVPTAGTRTVEVTCLGRTLVGRTGSLADECTLMLAEEARVDFLCALYLLGEGGPSLLAANATPDLRNVAIRGAFVDYFRARR